MTARRWKRREIPHLRLGRVLREHRDHRMMRRAFDDEVCRHVVINLKEDTVPKPLAATIITAADLPDPSNEPQFFVVQPDGFFEWREVVALDPMLALVNRLGWLAQTHGDTVTLDTADLRVLIDHVEQQATALAEVAKQRDAARRELRDRELHHFETERAMTAAREELLTGYPGRIMRAERILREALSPRKEERDA